MKCLLIHNIASTVEITPVLTDKRPKAVSPHPSSCQSCSPSSELDHSPRNSREIPKSEALALAMRPLRRPRLDGAYRPTIHVDVNIVSTNFDSNFLFTSTTNERLDTNQYQSQYLRASHHRNISYITRI